MSASSFWILPAFAVVASAVAISAPQNTGKQTPPVKMGTSGGSANDASHFYCCGGTLGSLVTRDGVLSILSNNHVLARSGIAATGEDTLQPGLIDSNCSGATSNIVGDFAGNLVPLGTANVDAALSTARANVDATGSILGIGVPCSSVQAATIGMPVKKSGRTTGVTTGSVTSVNTSVQIQYQKGCNTGKKFNIVFTNQIVTGNMSAGGDSGSLLLSTSGLHPVGLLFAGSGSATIYNKAQDVVNAFSSGGHSFSFVGNNCATTGTESWPTPPADVLEVALQVKVENETELFHLPGVLGVGVGATEDNPLAPAIVLYVEAPNGRPRAIPEEVDGIPVRVILTDTFVAQ